jgi:DNA polymerase-3 subunit beta
MPGVTVRVTRLSGKFPDYTKVIPDVCEYTFNIEKSVIDRMVRMTALTTDTENLSIIFDIKKNKFITSCKTTKGESKIEHDIIYEGDELKFKLNPRYVRAGLRAIDGDNVEVSFKNSVGPMVMRGESDYRHMISPMTL